MGNKGKDGKAVAPDGAESAAQEPVPAVPPGTGKVVLAFTCLASLGFLGFVVVYAHFGTALVHRLDSTIGETLFEQGRRFEQAHEYENALQSYRQALDCRFDREESRTFALKSLGALLWWREGPEQALPYLEEAYTLPNRPISLYEPLCDALTKVGRADEALDVAAQWFEDAREKDRKDLQALAKSYEGRAYLGQDATDKALDTFLEGNRILAGGVNAYEAGMLYRKAGKDAEALEYIEIFLQGGSGARARHARALRQQLLEQKQATPDK